MKRPTFLSHRRRGLEIKMTPMIDVVFLLLIFFIWTARFQVPELDLPSALSTASGTETVVDDPPPEMDFDQVVVRIVWLDGAPGWQLNNQAIDGLGELESRLRTIASIKRDARIIVHPDAGVPLGDVVDVYDLTRLAGFDETRLATPEEI